MLTEGRPPKPGVNEDFEAVWTLVQDWSRYMKKF